MSSLKIYKPTSPARRHTSAVKDDLSRERPLKTLTYNKKSHSGRNSQGKITVRHRGGGAKRRVRVIDFLQEKYNIPAIVESIEYDPNRGARIALILYTDGEKRYILAPLSIKIGTRVMATKEHGEIVLGNRMPLQYIPVGIQIHNLEFFPGRGGQIVRGAGAGAEILALDGEYAHVKMPSGEIRLFRKGCMASIGSLSNEEHRHVRIGKAGRMRHLGIRPTVRGKAMNPVDHPHGGGEGHNPIGLKHPKTPWGRPALGVKTRKKKSSDRLILSRRKIKKRKK